MANKKITDLPDSTGITDNDLFAVGDKEGASLVKAKWSAIWTKISTSIIEKLVANNLVTTAAGFLLDARQGKVLDDKFTELNTKLSEQIVFKTITIPINVPVTNGTNKELFNGSLSAYLDSGYKLGAFIAGYIGGSSGYYAIYSSQSTGDNMWSVSIRPFADFTATSITGTLIEYKK